MKKMRLCSIGLAIVCALTACTSQGTAVNGSKTAGQDRTAVSAEAQDSAVQNLPAAAEDTQDSSAQGLSTAPAGTQDSAVQDLSAAAAGTQEVAAQDTAAGMSPASETAGSQIPHSSVHGTYVNEEKGWYVQYEPALFTVKEEKDDVTFLYKGEAAGENFVEIRYIPGKEAREALTAELEQLQEERGVEEDDITRDEWYFFEKTWGYIASTEYSDDGGDVTVFYQSAEYNGGVILTKLLEHMTDESILEWEMDVALRKIVETLSFYHYDAQTEFSYVPGTYSRTESDGDAVDKIILKKDHTGTIIFQDQIPVYWGSYLLTEKNTGKSYEYTIEGEMLLLNLDDQWIEFEKTENPEEGSSLLDDPDYVQALNREIDTLYKDSTGNVGRIHKMQAFILELALHAKTQNPDFQIIGQNGVYLAYNDGVFEKGDQTFMKDLVDGWGVEGIVGKEESLEPGTLQNMYIDQVKKGKYVSDTTTVQTKEELENYLARADAWGIVPYPRVGGELAEQLMPGKRWAANGDYFWVEDPSLLGMADRMDGKRDINKLADAKSYLYNVNSRPYDNWQDWDKEEEEFENTTGAFS